MADRQAPSLEEERRILRDLICTQVLRRGPELPVRLTGGEFAPVLVMLDVDRLSDLLTKTRESDGAANIFVFRSAAQDPKKMITVFGLSTAMAGPADEVITRDMELGTFLAYAQRSGKKQLRIDIDLNHDGEATATGTKTLAVA